MAQAVDYDSHDLDVMARTLWGEARGEGPTGRVAVAWVIRNRLKRPERFAPAIAGVCKQPWQFSCWNASDPNRPKMEALTDVDHNFRDCREIARDVLEGTAEDPTRGAQFYYNPDVVGLPKWARGHTPCAKVGHHLFFNDVS